MKKLIYLILPSLIIFSCKHELEHPTWDVDMIVPLVYSEMTIENMLTDNNLNTFENEEGYITLVYQQDFMDMNYDTLINIDAIAGEKTTKLDSVTFADVTIADTATIGEAIAEIPFGPTLFPDGSTNSIPALAGMMNEDTIVINASEYFETMTLHKGWLIIRVINNFPTDISNISLSLINEVNQDVIASFSFALIPIGTTAIDSVDISGKTLDKNLSAIVHNLDVEASNGAVMINYDDAIITQITISDIGITEATAIFPEQEISASLKEHIFDMNGAKITKIGVKEGSVSLHVISTLPNGRIIYSIPSLTKNGVPFYTENTIPPTVNGEISSFSFDFSGYTLDLTGEEGRLGGDTVNTIYTETYSYIDSTGELITLNHADSFYSFTEFHFIPEYALGYLGQDTITFSEEIDFDVLKNIKADSLDLDKVNLTLKIENSIGADARLMINDLSGINDNTANEITLLENFTVNIDRATLTNNSLPINHTVSETQLDAAEFLELLPNKLKTEAYFYLNPNGPSITTDFLYPEYPLNASMGLEIPLNFIAKNLIFTDTSDININTNDNIEIDKLYLTVTNGLPLDATINLILLDNANITLHTIDNLAPILAAKVDNQLKVTEATTSMLELNYTDFKNAKKLIIQSSFTTQPQNNFISIYSDYSMNMTISAKYRKTLGN